jgi:hypothetical protein
MSFWGCKFNKKKQNNQQFFQFSQNPHTFPQSATLEDNALVADIKRALKLIRGIASVRVATISDDNTITPAMRRSINKARREYANGKTIKCSTPEEMQRCFDSL